MHQKQYEQDHGFTNKIKRNNWCEEKKRLFEKHISNVSSLSVASPLPEKVNPFTS